MKLIDWLARERITKTAFARRVGVSLAHIIGICKGDHLPSLTVAWAIERETGGAVTTDDWRSATPASRDEGAPPRADGAALTAHSSGIAYG